MSTSEGDENFRAAITELYQSARSKETALLAEYAMLKARIGTPIELPDDESRIVEICHRMKSVQSVTHPDIKRIVEGGPLPHFSE